MADKKTTNYYDTFIRVAEDCPVDRAEVPPARDPRTSAQIQYEMLSGNPYGYSSDDVLYAANGERRGISREEFFSKGQPCFRSSPLTKRYGWGIHSDEEGRIALYAVESKRYDDLSQDNSNKQLAAMRSKRI
ncbi:MAG: DUF6157 family protein [Actinomycetota bacterium]